MRLLFDKEANNLLNEATIDYGRLPYKLLPTYKLHCMSVRDIDTNQKWFFEGWEEMARGVEWMIANATLIVGHNILDYDLLSCKLAFGTPYYFLWEPRDRKTPYNGTPCMVGGRIIHVWDTLVVSKCLNPDRWGGHSLDAWGKRLGVEKIDWRAKAIELNLIQPGAPKGAEFATYHPEMGKYCERDTELNVAVFKAQEAEIGAWPWTDSLDLEHWVRDIITHQTHRGMVFNSGLARENLAFLDAEMERIRTIVEPLLPPKKMGLTEQKAYIPPKKQFLGNGNPSALLTKFIEKHSGSLDRVDGVWHWSACGQAGVLPIPHEPLVSTSPASVGDSTHIKGWLKELGWQPTQYKERDLTCNTKKEKLSEEKFNAAVERYVAQTLSSPFCADRCFELDTTPEKLRAKLLKHNLSRPLKVYTNPTFTVGMEKEIDPALRELETKFPYVGLVCDYLTYAHRRNSILGGGVVLDDEWEDMDEEDREWSVKGFLTAVRPDGRIPTPADSCGAGTSRFKHRVVANIPRVTSKFGRNMRAMFGVGADMIQWGYDFDSLEARIEGHYVWPYEGGPEYAESLVALKPHDCHTVLATKISALIGRAFPRGSAKNVKYGCTYGAQIPRTAKTIGCDLETAAIVYNAFWESALPLRLLKERMEAYWSTTGGKKFLRGIDWRKLPIRSKSNLLNSAFQSAGVICAKRAMVIHAKKLKDAGMYIDVFKDSGDNPFSLQLIAYHDEAQGEVTKSVCKFKSIKVDMQDDAAVKEAEERLKTWAKDKLDTLREVWSDVGHTKDAAYIGWTLPGQLATEAVREAGEYYNLNVPLSAGYMLGRNWAECH